MPNKWDEEEASEEEKQPVTRVAVATGKKWDDEEDEDVLESWDAADDSEEEREKAKKAAEKAAQAAKEHKSKTERIAEHQKQAAATKAKQAAAAKALANETPAERRRREEESDLKHAEALFADVDDRADGAAANPANKAADDVRRKAIALADPKDPSKSIDLSALPLFNPSTKQQFTDLQNVLTPLITANLRKGQYPLFVQELVRNLVKDMSSENIKKVVSIVTTLSNEKLREEKAAQNTKKSTKGKKQPTLVGAATKEDRIDTSSYADVYADDDFM